MCRYITYEFWDHCKEAHTYSVYFVCPKGKLTLGPKPPAGCRQDKVWRCEHKDGGNSDLFEEHVYVDEKVGCIRCKWEPKPGRRCFFRPQKHDAKSLLAFDGPARHELSENIYAFFYWQLAQYGLVLRETDAWDKEERVGLDPLLKKPEVLSAKK